MSFDEKSLDAALAAGRAGDLLVVAAALAAPFVLPWLAARRARRRGRPAPARAGGIVTGLVVGQIAMAFVYCHGGVYVGDEPRKRFAVEAAAPVVAALERYHAARGAYPDSLAQLAPAFVPAGRALRALPARDDFPGGLSYERGPAGYVLSFRYIGPGANTCTYTPADRRWACSGLL